MTGMRPPPAASRKSAAETGARFTLSSPTGGSASAGANSPSSTARPPAMTRATRHSSRFSSSTRSARQPGRHQATVAQPEGIGARPARRPVDRVARPAERDQPADHEVEVPLLADIERIAVVGAQRHERWRYLVSSTSASADRSFAHGAFADQDRHPLGELLARLCRARRLMVGADSRGEIGVEVAAGQKRRVPVDVAVLEGGELVERARVAGQHAGKVHELRQPDDLGMVAQGHEIGGGQLRPGGLEHAWRARRRRGSRACPLPCAPPPRGNSGCRRGRARWRSRAGRRSPW